MTTILGHVLGLSSIAIGAMGIVAPVAAGQGLRLSEATSKQSAFGTRAIGSRDVAFGLAIEAYASTTPEYRLVILGKALIHAWEPVNALISYSQGQVPWDTVVFVGFVDVVVAGLCFWELSRGG